MKRILMITVALALLALVAVVPTSSAAPEYEARVEDPSVPLTIVGTSYDVGSSIKITIRVANTGAALFGYDVGAVIFIIPDPIEGAEYVGFSVSLSGMKPGEYATLVTPAIKLNFAGDYLVTAGVYKDWNGDRVWTDPDELISNRVEQTFTVGSASDYAATVEIVSIEAAALGGLAALGGGLLGVRFF